MLLQNLIHVDEIDDDVHVTDDDVTIVHRSTANVIVDDVYDVAVIVEQNIYSVLGNLCASKTEH